MKAIWNDRFARDEYIYGEQPNEFFRAELDKLSPGSLLLPGEGEGRNAVWAAKQGWGVTALDYSEIGRDKALRLASRQKIQLADYLLVDLNDYMVEANSFDAIALIYVHLEPDLRSKTHRMLADALKPGGTLILEAFNTGQMTFDTGGPKNPDLLYSTEILHVDFESLQIVMLENCFALLNEGNYHNGKAALVRLVAQKVL